MKKWYCPLGRFLKRIIKILVKTVKICFVFLILKVGFVQKTYTFVQDFGDRNAFVRNFY